MGGAGGQSQAAAADAALRERVRTCLHGIQLYGQRGLWERREKGTLRDIAKYGRASDLEDKLRRIQNELASIEELEKTPLHIDGE